MTIRIIFSQKDNVYLPGNDSRWIDRFKAYIETGVKFIFDTCYDVVLEDIVHVFSKPLEYAKNDVFILIASELSFEEWSKYNIEFGAMQDMYKNIIFVSKSTQKLQTEDSIETPYVVHFSGLYNTTDNLAYLQQVTADGVTKRFVTGIVDVMKSLHKLIKGVALDLSKAYYMIYNQHSKEQAGKVIDFCQGRIPVVYSVLNGDMMAIKQLHQAILTSTGQVVIFCTAQNTQWAFLKVMEIAKVPGVVGAQPKQIVHLVHDTQDLKIPTTFGVPINKISNYGKSANELAEMLV